MRTQRRGEMRTGGESEDADAPWVQGELGRALAQQAECTLRVLQCGRVIRQSRPLRHAVLEQGGGDAERIEPLADLGAFEIEREDVIAATGADHHGGAGVTVRGRLVEGEGRLRDVAEADQTFAADQTVRRLRGVLLGADAARFAGCGTGPERDDFGWFGGHDGSGCEPRGANEREEPGESGFHAVSGPGGCGRVKSSVTPTRRTSRARPGARGWGHCRRPWWAGTP